MPNKPSTVTEYLKGLPSDQRTVVSALRKAVKNGLPDGYKETMQHGMISYVVPLSTYPDGYLGDKKTPLPYVSIGAQKRHVGLYLCNVYMDEKIGEWFAVAFKKTGKRLDMGKSCVRFADADGIPLDLVEKVVAKTPPKNFIMMYENGRKKR